MVEGICPNGGHRSRHSHLTHQFTILEDIGHNSGQAGAVAQINIRQTVAVLEGRVAQNLQFRVQRDTCQFLTIRERIIATAVRTARSLDILTEYDTHDITAVAYITTDVFHRMTLAIDGYGIGNHDMAGL